MMESIIYVITHAAILLIIIELRGRRRIQKQEVVKWYPENEVDADVGHIILHTKNGEGNVLVNEKLQRDYAMDKKSFEEIILDINPSFYDDYELTKKEKPERNAEYYRNKQKQAYNDMVPKWEKRAKEVFIELMDEVDKHSQDNPLSDSYTLSDKKIVYMTNGPLLKGLHWFYEEDAEVKEIVEKKIKKKGFRFETLYSGDGVISWGEDAFAKMSDSIGGSDTYYNPAVEQLKNNILNSRRRRLENLQKWSSYLD